MNFQPIIDNLPYEIATLGFLFWAIEKILRAIGDQTPGPDKWGTRADQLHMVADKYSQAVEWLVTSGFVKWSGAEKLAEVQKRVKSFETLWDAGKYLDALAELSGFYQSAKSKIEKAHGTLLPFATPLPTATSPRGSGSLQAQAGIGPDDPAQ